MDYDVCVIGAGSGGLNVAGFFSRIGMKVLMIEKHLIGGDCLNTGCVPSKALIHLAHIAHAAKKAQDLGLKVSGQIDLQKVADTIKERQDIIREEENPEHFRKKGIDVEIGEAKFTGDHSLTINGREITAKKFCIATGSRAFVPKVEGIEDVDYMTNETVFLNTKLPKKLLVIGAGPIGVEIGQSYQRLGSQVTIIARDHHLLPREEPEMSEILEEQFKEEGITLDLGVNPVRFEGKHTLVMQEWDAKERKNVGKERKVSFDQVLIATGRVLNTDGLDLEKAGVELEKGRLVLDAQLKTTNKDICAIGDVAGGFQFTHWAEYQAGIVIKNWLSPLKKTPDNSKIAWTTYTDPELATFGKQLPQIKEEYDSFKTIEVDVPSDDRYITDQEKRGKLKVYLVDGKLVGGTMIGKAAGEITAEFILAMTLGIKFDKIFDRIYPYPGLTRVNRRALQQYLGEKLNDKSIKVLQKLFKVFA